MKSKRLRWANTHKFIALAFYYGLFKHFPRTSFPIVGKLSCKLRVACCKVIFKHCGKNVNIERGAVFGCGFDIEIGDRSGIGINAHIPSDTIIGNNVNMGPEVFILSRNHCIDRTDIIMQKQGYAPEKQTIIGDDVWIGRQVTMTPGRNIAKGSVIGACCLLCKDFPEYSVVGGNPAKLIRNRLDSNGK
jgi:maltose O-acetyltransferase